MEKKEGQLKANKNSLCVLRRKNFMLHLYLGPMFSGKTSQLMHDLETFSDLGKRVLAINASIDSRVANTNNTSTNAENNVSTHSSRGVHSNGKVIWQRVTLLGTIDVTKFDIIGVDECQFFPDLVSSVKHWLSLRKYIICAGLDSDFKQEPIGDTLKLIPFATRAIKLCAKCHRCLQKNGTLADAPVTCRRDKSDNSITVIGGADKYEALCIECLLVK